MSDDRTRVAECAYYIWEKEGRPSGKDMEHWFRAEIALSEAAAPPRSEPKAERRKTSARPRRTKVNT